MHLQKRTRNKDGKSYEYWELVESYRTERGPRRRSVAYLGVVGPGERLGVKLAAEDQIGSAQGSLFDEVEPEWVEVDTKRVRVEHTRQFGGEGCYILRSNVNDWSAEELWKAYIQLTEAESAFRIHKSDLSLRPTWHQKKERVQAHILVCFLAYVLWKTLARLCSASGLGDEPRKVFDEIAQVQVVDVVLPTKNGVEIRRRCVGRPTKHQAILLQHLRISLPTNLKVVEM